MRTMLVAVSFPVVSMEKYKWQKIIIIITLDTTTTKSFCQ